jgi:hypothetical protein
MTPLDAFREGVELSRLIERCQREELAETPAGRAARKAARISAGVIAARRRQREARRAA